jgi:hypothetical protein
LLFPFSPLHEKGKNKMATNPTPKELVVKGAGPVITSNQVLMVQAFANQDIETIKAQMVFFENLSKVVSSYRQAACKQYDMATSGYVNADWLNGVERLVKKDPDKPRGRKATVKPDPADNC